MIFELGMVNLLTQINVDVLIYASCFTSGLSLISAKQEFL